jgi:hypothetical protein
MKIFSSLNKVFGYETYRYLSECLFERLLLNGEKTPWKYVVYSKSKGSVVVLRAVYLEGQL